jgi:hypothetical protein
MNVKLLVNENHTIGTYTEKKSCDTKPKKGFVQATKPLKGLLVCNEIETLF